MEATVTSELQGLVCQGPLYRRRRVRRKVADIEHGPQQFRFRQDRLRLRLSLLRRSMSVSCGAAASLNLRE
jgi:hypothetical protein